MRSSVLKEYSTGNTFTVSHILTRLMPKRYFTYKIILFQVISTQQQGIVRLLIDPKYTFT